MPEMKEGRFMVGVNFETGNVGIMVSDGESTEPIFFTELEPEDARAVGLAILACCDQVKSTETH